MTNGLMFDATQFAPKQSAAPHPVGNGFLGTVTRTAQTRSKNNNEAGFLEVEFTSEGGRIVMRYNLWNPSAKAVEIAQGQLSALCHATGVYRLSMGNEGRELLGAKLRYDVSLQDVNDPNGYVQVARVYDVNGNEPGTTPQNNQAGGNWSGGQNQPNQVTQQAPVQNQQFNAPVQEQAPQNTQPQQSWGAPVNAQQQSAPQQQGGPSWPNSQPQQQNAAPQNNQAGDLPPWAR